MWQTDAIVITPVICLHDVRFALPPPSHHVGLSKHTLNLFRDTIQDTQARSMGRTDTKYYRNNF